MINRNKNMTYIWRLKKWLPERYGQRCRVTTRGAKGNIRVEFEDNYSVITSRFAVRKITKEVFNERER